MKLIQETDIFTFMNNGNEAVLNKQISNLLASGSVVLTPYLEYQFATMAKAFKDPLCAKTLVDIKNGSIIPIVAKTPNEAMPIYMPFIKYKDANGLKIAVDLSQFCTLKVDNVNNETDVSIDTKKLYCILISAYIYLHFGDKTTVITPVLMAQTASVWAKMFCKILDLKVGLSTNLERKDAFMYLACKFYLINIIEAPEGIVNDIAIGMFKNKRKNKLASYIETIVEDQNIPLYKDFTTFVTTLFNNEITGIRAIRLRGSTEVLNLSYYMKQFIELYYVPAGFAIASFPYFMWMLISANNWAYIFHDQTIESLSKDEYPKIISEVYRMIR